MKNKKGLSEIIVVIIMVAFALVAVGLVYAVIMNIFGEPHFKIMKEECGNETTNLYIESQNQGCNLACFEFEYDNLDNCLGFCDESFIYEKEVCEQVEVDEVEVVREDLGVVMVATINRNSIYPQLSVEWLEENCDCVYYGFSHKGFYCYDVGDFDGKKIIEIGKEYCETEEERLERGCKRYKCGNYIVETRSQLE